MDMNAYEKYMREIHEPARKEMESYGFTQLQTVEEVDAKMEELKEEGTALIFVNSVCGCAAGTARPAAEEALLTVSKKPDHLVTVFAGQDKEATDRMREYFAELPPSSPSMVIWKDGAVAYYMPREQIEGYTQEQVAANLAGMLEEFCGE